MPHIQQIERSGAAYLLGSNTLISFQRAYKTERSMSKHSPSIKVAIPAPSEPLFILALDWSHCGNR